MISDFALKGVIVCAAFAAQTIHGFADGVIPNEDIYAYYGTNIHSRATGCYEDVGWVFFHQRRVIPDDGIFTKNKVGAKAMAAATADIFKWIDGNIADSNAVHNASVTSLRTLADRFGDERTAVRRTLKGLLVKILHRDKDDANPQEYVLDLAIRQTDLLAEAGRGRFEDREEVIVEHWRKVAKARISGPDRMSFLRDAGAMDLWTIDSEKTSGCRVLQFTNELEVAFAKECISNLTSCARQVDSDAAREYAALTENLYSNICREVELTGVSVTSTVVRVMLESFASCPTERTEVPDAAWDAYAPYVDGSRPVAETINAMVTLLDGSPGVKEFWMTLGDTFEKNNGLTAALSCYRNALRLDNGDALVFEAMTRMYGKLGCPNLARGTAIMAFGLATECVDCPEAMKIIGEK